MAALTEAVNLEPGEAVYYGYMGSYAYKLAIASEDATEKSKLLDLSAAAYGVAGKREPYLAYWSYTTGDVYAYWAGHLNPGKWKDALRYYERADILLPGDAVILNKWALALMQNGDYVEAGRKLTQSQDADREWIQTTYLRGLLEVYQSCYCTAGNCFVYPARSDPVNLGPYMGFCKQLSLYGGIDKVVEGLKVYTGCHRDDWLGLALLGIADVYGGNIKDGSAAFLNAAGKVTVNDASLLNEIVSATARENKDFQVPAKDIQARLASIMEE
jgi:tetratricopeptide (TPR) repeat protein